MDLIVAAWKDLQDRLVLVLAYVGLHGLLLLLVGLAEMPLARVVGEGEIPPWAATVSLLSQFVTAGLAAAIQAIILARLGRELDRPLWKCGSDLEALKRFWMPWFLLALGFTLFSELASLAVRNDLPDAAAMMLLLSLIYQLIVIPVGACVMYWGRLEWNELVEALRPIARQFSLVVFVFMLQAGQFMMQFVLQGALVGYAPDDIERVFVLALGIMPLNLIEVLAFVTMWRILIINRDAPEDNEDDFDF